MDEAPSADEQSELVLPNSIAHSVHLSLPLIQSGAPENCRHYYTSCAQPFAAPIVLRIHGS